MLSFFFKKWFLVGFGLILFWPISMDLGNSPDDQIESNRCLRTTEPNQSVISIWTELLLRPIWNV